MKKIILIISVIIASILIIFQGMWLLIRYQNQQNEIVATYESSLDDIGIDYDDDNHRYDVFVNNTHYYVNEDKIKLLPYYKNEVVVEITRSGKCYLYFFIELEVQDEERRNV